MKAKTRPYGEKPNFQQISLSKENEGVKKIIKI